MRAHIFKYLEKHRSALESAKKRAYFERKPQVWSVLQNDHIYMDRLVYLFI